MILFCTFAVPFICHWVSSWHHFIAIGNDDKLETGAYSEVTGIVDNDSLIHAFNSWWDAWDCKKTDTIFESMKWETRLCLTLGLHETLGLHKIVISCHFYTLLFTQIKTGCSVLHYTESLILLMVFVRLLKWHCLSMYTQPTLFLCPNTAWFPQRACEKDESFYYIYGMLSVVGENRA